MAASKPRHAHLCPWRRPARLMLINERVGVMYGGDWALEHSLMRSETSGSQSTFTAQSVRIFSRTQDELRFPLKYLFYTQCIRNQHFK